MFGWGLKIINLKFSSRITTLSLLFIFIPFFLSFIGNETEAAYFISPSVSGDAEILLRGREEKNRGIYYSGRIDRRNVNCNSLWNGRRRKGYLNQSESWIRNILCFDGEQFIRVERLHKKKKKGRRENPSILTLYFDTLNYNSINFTFDGILLKKISILIFKKKILNKLHSLVYGE